MESNKILRFASVDIGSNAMRLLLCNVYDGNDGPVFKKTELYRFPLRLGEDSFLKGYISEETIRNLCRVMTAYRLFIEAYGVVSFRVCATSAMREASNQSEVIKRVKKESGLQIEVIDGAYEAKLIYSNHVEEHLDHDFPYLYIDVGGGSTEVTLFAGGRVVDSGSFNIGTIRMLHDMVSREQWSDFKSNVKRITNGYEGIIGIGSGGNINKIFKMAGKKDNRFVSLSRIRELADMVSALSVEDRIAELRLNPDRADVIVPAFRIFIAIMKAASIEKIMVPQVGLSDGIIHLLYEEYLKSAVH